MTCIDKANQKNVKNLNKLSNYKLGNYIYHFQIKMPKRKYYTWSKENLEEAIQKYNNGALKYNEACSLYNIPKPTFRRHLKGLNTHQRLGRPNDLTDEMESELVKHVLLMESRFFGLSITDLRHLAYQLAEKHGLTHRFNKETQLAGWKWYYKFIKNHPEISLRSPEATSMARCKGFNKETVMAFFDKYESILDEGQFTADKIFNMDETGLNTVHKPSKILAQKGKHQIGAVTSGERGVNTTCICCVNAAGEFVPPMLIFKRKRMTEDLKRGRPPNTLYECSESGWIVSTLFVKWLEHFIKCLRLQKSNENQILLILDGHSTHTKNLDAINLAREYGIIMFSLPAHTTHKLQPLDRSFFKSLKQKFNAACVSWMRNHPGSVIKQSNIAEILGEAYPRAVCMNTGIHGFESCGLWPCNRHKIRDEEYVVLDEVSNLSESETCTPNRATEIQPELKNSCTLTSVPQSNQTTEQKRTEEVDDVQLPESTCPPEKELNPRQIKKTKKCSMGIEANVSNTKTVVETLEMLSPTRAIPGKSNQLKRKTTAAVVITGSPYKTELENKIEESKKKTVSKNLDAKESKPTNRSRKGNKKQEQKKDESWFCKICEEDRKENMTQCTNCEIWVHDLCAGTNKKTHVYNCDDCQELATTIRRIC